jgi:hypothetical protein
LLSRRQAILQIRLFSPDESPALTFVLESS